MKVVNIEENKNLRVLLLCEEEGSGGTDFERIFPFRQFPWSDEDANLATYEYCWQCELPGSKIWIKLIKNVSGVKMPIRPGNQIKEGNFLKIV